MARVRDTSSGDLGSALLSGSSACSSLSLIAGLSSSCSFVNPSERRREPITDEGANAAAPKANTAVAMVRNSTAASIVSITSHLDLNDFADQEKADRLQDHAHHNQHVSNRIAEQGLDKVRVHYFHDQHDDRRQCHQQEHREPPLRRVNPHLPLNLEPLAYHVRQIVENFRQVAARLALQHHRRHEKFHVHDRNAFCQVQQRIAYRQSELLLFKELA